MQLAKPGPRVVLVTILLDAMGFGLVAPVLPHLVAALDGRGPAAASHAFGAIQAAYAGAMFLCAPLVGRLSDRFGRRPVLLLALAGAALDHLVAAVAGSLSLLFAARLIAGAFGASAAAASAYIADTTSADERGKAFAFAGAAFAIGFVSGPALGGLLGDFGPRVPFLAAAGLTALNLAYALFVLPESLAPERRKPLDLGALNPLAGLIGWRRSRLIGGLLAAIFLYMLAQSALQATYVLYMDLRLGWGPRDVGASLGVLGVMAILAQVLLAPRLIRARGPRAALLGGLLATSLFCLVLSQVTAGWQVYAALLLVPFAMIAGPAAQALLSGGAEDGRQGLLQGTISSVTGLAAFFGPPLGASIFGWFAGPAAPLPLPGAAFVLAALLALAAMAVSARATRG